MLDIVALMVSVEKPVMLRQKIDHGLTDIIKIINAGRIALVNVDLSPALNRVLDDHDLLPHLNTGEMSLGSSLVSLLILVGTGDQDQAEKHCHHGNGDQ
jgi:hypothetical protein